MMEFDTKTTTVPGASTISSKPSYKAEEGWLCPRCQRINAPWVRQCDCSSNNYGTWAPTWSDGEWWKTHITCEQADAHTYSTAQNTTTGGSDDNTAKIWFNVLKNVSNIKETY